LNFASVAPTSVHTEGIFSVVFEISAVVGVVLMNVSIPFRPKLVDACNRWLSGPDKVYIVGPVKRSASDQHHPTPQPEVPAGVD
jgi:hypothetical protein